MTKKWKPVGKKPSTGAATGNATVQPDRKLPTHRNANKRTDAEIQADELLIEQMSIEGWTQVAIAKEITNRRRYSLSSYQVGEDLKRIKARWRAEVHNDIQAYVAKELKGLEKQEKELWKAWKKSKRDAEKEVVSEGEFGTNVTTTREGQSGAVAFQNALFEIRKQRRELLGLDKPTKIANTNLEGTESYQPLVIAVAPEDMPKARKK